MPGSPACRREYHDRPAPGRSDAHARLEDAVAAGHHRFVGVEARAVQRMRDRAGELARRVARQLRVGVQRDHVFHARQHRDLPDDEREAALAAAAQQRIEVRELAALALVPHPQLFLRVPAARPVEQEEDVAGRRVVAGRLRGRVLLVERVDALLRGLQKTLVVGHRLRGGIREVGQQAVVQVRVSIGEVADFQRLDQVLDVVDARDHRRHHDQRARCRRDPARIIHARQRMRRHDQHRQPVHHANGELARGDREQENERDERTRRNTEAPHGLQQSRGDDCRDSGHCCQVQRQRVPPRAAPHDLRERDLHAGGALELRPAFVDEIEADVGLALVVAIDGTAARGGVTGHPEREPRHVAFRHGARARDRLDDVPVAVAGGEVHAAVEAARVVAQRRFDDAHRLDEVAPVGGAEEAQAADRVADRHLGARLLLRFDLHELLDRQMRLGEALLDPGQRQRERRALALQPARELGDERARHRRARARHVGGHDDQALGIALGDLEHLLGPPVGALAVDRAGGHARADAPQVLDERQAQHDRDRPQLAELERRDRLVRRDEARQRLGVDAAVAVRDRLEGEVVDARKSGRRSCARRGSSRL
jgi:hypothetical protein